MRNLLAVLLVAAALAGCMSSTPPATDGPATGNDSAALPTFFVNSVGEQGPEPTLGVTSDGAIFFQALEKTMKSIDGGRTWSNVNPAYALPTTLDPFLWVDPTTDRVFSDQLYVACSYLLYTDDGGATWVPNPLACGSPVNDHQKIATGSYVAGGPLDLATPVKPYPNLVYYAINGIADSRVGISLDGGQTFPIVSESFPAVQLPGGDSPDCGGGLHGNIVAGPDGTVYVPSRSSCAGPDEGTLGGPVVARSLDNGLTWTNTVVAADIGTPDHDKNPDLAVDTENTVYITFPGGDNRLYLAHSVDHGATWSQAVLVSDGLGTVTMPALAAGSPGRVAMAYYGVADPNERAVPDFVNETARWSLFVTYSLDALSDTPTFTTIQVTGDDPIQVGGISTNSGDAPAGSRNLLDFIDLQIDAEGRVFVAFADGCTSDVCRGPDAKPEDSRDALGIVAIGQSGPSLFADKGELAPLLA
ncbi:MAG: sialidase family protein [Candidatus Thermoplasmatota archaeon]